MLDLMAAEWKDVLLALAKVPEKARDGAWQKTVDLIKSILDGPSSVTVPAVPTELRWAPACDICHGPIRLDHDFVYKAISCTHKHYDCLHRSSEGEMA